MIKRVLISILVLACTLSACRKKIKIQEDELYSRHLQQHVKLTIISTELPDDKHLVNLLLLNDGQDVNKLRVKETLDSLYKKKLIGPLIIVAIHAGKRQQWYGVAGQPDYEKRGDKADNYMAFIDNELYPFIKKNTGVKKFNCVAIAGVSLGGLSAMDIAWNNADKIDKVGVFSGSFWWRDKDVKSADYSDAVNRILLKTIQSSRKKPKQQYWLYAGLQEEIGDRDKDGVIDVADDTKDLVQIITNKKVCPPGDIIYTEAANGKHDYESWSKVLPLFLIWAFGR